MINTLCPTTFVSRVFMATRGPLAFSSNFNRSIWFIYQIRFWNFRFLYSSRRWSRCCSSSRYLKDLCLGLSSIIQADLVYFCWQISWWGWSCFRNNYRCLCSMFAICTSINLFRQIFQLYEISLELTVIAFVGYLEECIKIHNSLGATRPSFEAIVKRRSSWMVETLFFTIGFKVLAASFVLARELFCRQHLGRWKLLVKGLERGSCYDKCKMNAIRCHLSRIIENRLHCREWREEFRRHDSRIQFAKNKTFDTTASR